MNEQSVKEQLIWVTGVVLIVAIISGGICYGVYLDNKLTLEAIKQGYIQTRDGSLGQPLWKKAN